METPLAVVGQAPRVKALFAKFDKINDPLISAFTASVPEKFSDAAGRLASKSMLASEFIMRNRLALKPFITKFHSEACTMTGKVDANISLLDDPTAQIVVSTHQPNLFAYSGVFKKIVLLEALKDSVEKINQDKKIVNLFLVVDHDFVDELWVRLAQLPSVQHSSGILELRLPVSESKKWQMVCNFPVPSKTVMSNWKHQVKSWIKNSSSDSDKKIFVENFERIWQQFETCYSRAKSYADLNSFFMSKIVNEDWNYSTLFVRLSEISSVFENGFTFLVSNYGIYADALRRTESMFMSHGIDTGVSAMSHMSAPVWVHCKCGSKASARIARRNGGIVLEGPCMSCKKELKLDLGNPDNLDLGQFTKNLSPRAIPIPLLLSRDLGISCYASGTGGIGYLVDGGMVSKKLGLEVPMIMIWPSRDVYSGIGQAEALGSIEQALAEDIDSYLQTLGKRNAEYEGRIRPLLEQRAQKAQAGEPVDNILEKLFPLKEEQRQVRQLIKAADKARNAIRLSPCLLDYAINFGVAETEQKWRAHLLKNGDLASPVIF